MICNLIANPIQIPFAGVVVRNFFLPVPYRPIGMLTPISVAALDIDRFSGVTLNRINTTHAGSSVGISAGSVDRSSSHSAVHVHRSLPARCSPSWPKLRVQIHRPPLGDRDVQCPNFQPIAGRWLSAGASGSTFSSSQNIIHLISQTRRRQNRSTRRNRFHRTAISRKSGTYRCSDAPRTVHRSGGIQSIMQASIASSTKAALACLRA